MGVVVTFDYNAFIALFPEFAYLTQDQVTEYFNLATQYVRNDGGGPVTQASVQTTLLNLVTAHITKIFAPSASGQPSSDIVGRISSASQGSVSVSSENSYPPGSAQWWQQTKYGSAFWEASKVYRTMRYIPGPCNPVEPWPVAGVTWAGYNWGGWGW